MYGRGQVMTDFPVKAAVLGLSEAKDKKAHSGVTALTLHEAGLVNMFIGAWRAT